MQGAMDGYGVAEHRSDRRRRFYLEGMPNAEQ